MTDIYEKLDKCCAGMGVRNIDDYTAGLTVQDVVDIQNELKRLQNQIDAQVHILRKLFPEQSGDYFICGEGRKEGENPGELPSSIHVCPSFGADFFFVYEKTDKTGE